MKIKIAYFIPLLIVVSILFLVLKPAINSPLPSDAYVDLRIIQVDFSKNLSFFYPSLKYYLHQYGTQFTSIVLAYKLFGFNPQAYFILNIFLRISAAAIIYLFTVKWTKNKIAGVVAGIFFGVNLPGIQPTTRVAFFLVYVGVITLFLFLDRWLTFHYYPTGKNLKRSVIFFALAILSYPVRMVGTVPLFFLGEVYWLIKHYYKKNPLWLHLKHILSIIVVILIFMFITGTLATTPELSYKRVSPNILLTALLTGYPPVITTLWLFISNMIISPFLSNFSSFDPVVLEPLTIILPLAGIFFFLTCLLHRKFLIAFASLTAITFTPFVMASALYLEGWTPDWINITSAGGTLFLLSNLFLIYTRKRNEQLTEIGLLGSAITLSTILFPWLISPQRSGNDQSAFLFVHRYYTIPSAGIALLLATTVAMSLDYLKSVFYTVIKSRPKITSFQFIKGVIYLPVILSMPIIILYFTYWQGVSTNLLLTSQANRADSAKIELFWKELEPIVANTATPPATNYIYINNTSGIGNQFISDLADRITLSQRKVNNPPNVSFIFNEAEFKEKLGTRGVNDHIYALKFDGKELVDIKNNFLEINR